jgi:hypothetical protein
VPHALLRDADVYHADEGFLHFITEALKVPRRSVEHRPMVSPNALDVFDHQVGRPEYLSGSDHDEIQLVFLVSPTGVVVEVRVPLAWGAADEYVDLTDLNSCPLFGSGEGPPNGTVKPRADVSSLLSHTRLEIEVIDTPNVLVPLHREPHFEAPLEVSTSLGDAEGEPSGAGEEVNQSDWVRSPLVRRPRRPTEKSAVIAVDFIQGATHRFVTPAFANRRMTASGVLSSHCHIMKTL